MVHVGVGVGVIVAEVGKMFRGAMAARRSLRVKKVVVVVIVVIFVLIVCVGGSEGGDLVDHLGEGGRVRRSEERNEQEESRREEEGRGTLHNSLSSSSSHSASASASTKGSGAHTGSAHPCSGTLMPARYGCANASCTEMRREGEKASILCSRSRASGAAPGSRSERSVRGRRGCERSHAWAAGEATSATSCSEGDPITKRRSNEQEKKGWVSKWI